MTTKSGFFSAKSGMSIACDINFCEHGMLQLSKQKKLPEEARM